jgi:ribosomal protein S12 methylthiotransferase
MSQSAPRVWLTTLGCAKNQVDSEKISARLEAAGYQEADSPESADVVMVNTCAFIEAARRESIDAVLEAADAKRSDARLVVVGCMAQRYQGELAEALPEADAVIGLERYTELIGDMDRLTGWEPLRLTPPNPMDILYEVRRPAPDTPYAYVKVAEGCDKTCAFCAIPQFRGKQRSRAPVNIREEVAELTRVGVGEIVLVAQDLAAYGRDIGAPGGIVELLQFLSDIDDLRRLRLLYLYPREVTPALIEEARQRPPPARHAPPWQCREAPGPDLGDQIGRTDGCSAVLLHPRLPGGDGARRRPAGGLPGRGRTRLGRVLPILG